jgi:TRAP-type mannitol/chloroaromatic compound transport system substrate-binding protein
MKRRKFIAATAAAGASTVALSAPAISQGRMEWRLVTSWPKNLPGVGTGVERLAARIGEMSAGRLTVRVFAAGELVPALQCLQAVRDGTAEMGHDASYYHIGVHPAFQFFTCVPFGFTATEQSAWLSYGGGQQLWDEHAANYNIKAFAAGNTNTQAFGWYRREITGVESFRGLKVRMPGWGGQIMTRLGAQQVVLPGGEIFAALQSGAVDAAEWIGPYNDLAMGFHQVSKLCYGPGWHEPGSNLQLMVSKARYDALPADLKAIVAYAAQSMDMDMTIEYLARSSEAMTTLRTRHGVRFLNLSPQLLDAMGTAAGEHLADQRERGDAMVKKCFESYLKFRGPINAFNRWNDASFMNARVRTFKYVS